MNKLTRVLLLFLISCAYPDSKKLMEAIPVLKSGEWTFSLQIGKDQIHIKAALKEEKENMVFNIMNGDEIISIRNIKAKGDSIFMTLPVFGTILYGKIISDTLIEGFWRNTTKSNDYIIPFSAKYGLTQLYQSKYDTKPMDFNGKWEVTFNSEGESPCKSIGQFKQNDREITGTFLTETGDYRFLTGWVSKNKMRLSSFDGAHAFLFTAELDDSGTMRGEFWSGNHWYESWIGVRNENFNLKHPDSITYVSQKNIKLSLTKTDIDGKVVSLSDKKFTGKVLIIQIMGTWCPNCADESKDLARLYNRYRQRGLEILAVSYERSDKYDLALAGLRRFKKETGAEYPFLYGGKVDKLVIGQDFPMLNTFSSYPTTLYVDRAGEIRKIHTGYYGPGSGKYYIKYRDEMEKFIQRLLDEPVNS